LRESRPHFGERTAGTPARAARTRVRGIGGRSIAAIVGVARIIGGLVSGVARRSSKRSRRALAAAAALALGVAILSGVGSSGPAGAAELNPSPIQTVTITADSPPVYVNNIVTVDVTFAIPANTAHPGDTFTLTVPDPPLVPVPSTGFPLTNGEGGSNIGTCVISGQTMTCTLSSTYDSTQPVSNGEISFSVVAVAATDLGAPVVFTINGRTIDSDVPGGQIVPNSDTPQPPGPAPSTPTKFGGGYATGLWWVAMVPAARLPAGDPVQLTDTMSNSVVDPWSVTIWAIPNTDYRGNDPAGQTYYTNMGYQLCNSAVPSCTTAAGTFQVAQSTTTTANDTVTITLNAPKHSGYTYFIAYSSTTPTTSGGGGVTVTNTLTGSSPGAVTGYVVVNASGSGFQNTPHMVLTKQVCDAYDASNQPTCTVSDDAGWVKSATIPNGADALWRVTVANDGNTALTQVRFSTEALSGGTGYAAAGVAPDPSGTYSVGVLAIGESKSVLLPRTTGVTETVTAITNTAQVSGLPSDTSGNPTSSTPVVSNTDTADVLANAPSTPANCGNSDIFIESTAMAANAPIYLLRYDTSGNMRPGYPLLLQGGAQSRPGEYPYGDIAITVDEALVYAITDEGDVLDVFSTTTGLLVRSITVTGLPLSGETWNALSFDPDGNLLTGGLHTSGVYRIDMSTAATGTVTATQFVTYPTATPAFTSAGDFMTVTGGDIIASATNNASTADPTYLMRLHPNGDGTYTSFEIGTIPMSWGLAKSGGNIYSAAAYTRQLQRITIADLPTTQPASVDALPYTTMATYTGTGDSWWGAGSAEDGAPDCEPGTYGMSKQANPASGAEVSPGSTITYTVTATANDKPVDGIVLTDDLSNVLNHATFVPGSAQLSIGGGAPASVPDPVSNQLVTASFDLDARQSAVLSYKVTVASDAWSATLNNAAWGYPDPVSSCGRQGDPCRTTHTTPARGTYTLAKVADPPSGSVVSPGDTITYTVTAVASGNVVNGLVVTDDLSSVLNHATFVSGSAKLSVAGGAASSVADPGSDHLLVTSAFNLPAGASAVLTYQVRVDSDAWLVTLRNSVTGMAGGSQPPQSCDPCSTTHTTPGVLNIEKEGKDWSGAWQPISGSTFELLADDHGSPGSVITTLAPESIGQGLFQIAGVVPGTWYWLSETKAPPGFELLAEPVRFTMGADGTVTLGQGSGSLVTLDQDSTGRYVLLVQDVSAPALPAAGGHGSTPYVVTGGVLLLFAILVLLTILMGTVPRRRVARRWR